MNAVFPLLGVAVASTLVRRGPRGDGAATGFLPRRTGPVRVVHCLPGRIRFRIASRSVGPERLRKAAEQLRRIEGVKSVQVEERTRSVLVCYQLGQFDGDLLFAALVRLLGVEGELLQSPEPVLTRELREGAASLNQGVYEASGGLLDLSTLWLLGLLGLGANGVWTHGLRAVPNGVSLLWWAWLSLRPR